MFIKIENRYFNVAHIVGVDQQSMTLTMTNGEVFKATDRDSDLFHFIDAGGGQIIPAAAGWKYKPSPDEDPEVVVGWFVPSFGNCLPITVDRGFRWRAGYLATLIAPDDEAMIAASYMDNYTFHPERFTTVDKLEATYFELKYGRPPSDYAVEIFDRAFEGIEFHLFRSVYRQAKALEDHNERYAVAKVLKRQWDKIHPEIHREIVDYMLDHPDEPFIWDAAHTA